MDWLAYFLIGAIVLLIFRYGIFGADRARPVAPVALERVEPGDDVDGYEIVGESHYQRELVRLFGPKREHGIDEHCAAVLHLEPENSYDKNAVRCEISGLKVGYLSRDDAKEFRRYMRRQKVTSMRVTANVRGGWKKGADEGHYGLSIEVPADLV